LKIGARSRLLLLLGAMGCSKHPTSCISRPAAPSPSASAEVAKILQMDLPLEDAGDAESGEAFIEMVRRESWDEAQAALDALPEDRKKKPTVRLLRGRVAMARGDYGAALEAFAGLEKELSPIAEDLEKWRAECQANVGPYPQAADFFAKQGGTKSLVRAALAFDKAGMPSEARGAADKAISSGKGDAAEVPVRMLRMRLAESAGQRSVAAEDARFVVVRAPASPESKEAMAALERLDPAKPLTGKERMQRADRLVDAGRTDDALDELARAAKAPSPPDEDDIAWARAFALYKARGRYDKAAAQFAKLGSKPGGRQAEALFYAARSQSRADHDEEAASAYRAVARRFPNSSFGDEAAYLAARLSFLHASWNDASTGYSAYLKKFPSGKQRDSATYERALSYLAGGNYASARTELHGLAANAGPSDGARLRELEGVAAAKAGDKDGAVTLWNDVIHAQPLSWAATVSRARIAENGAPIPPVIDASDGRASEALVYRLPPIAVLYHRLGLDSDADSYLRSHEHEAVADIKGRDKEALCAMYADLGRANRLYRIGVDAVPSALLLRAPSEATEWGWKCLYPRPYFDRVREIESREQLPKGLIYAVMRQESAYDPDAVSGARAVGLLQLMPETAKRVAAEAHVAFEEKLLRTPSLNLELGGRYLGKMLRAFGGSIPLAAAGYNAGPRAVRRWQERMKGLDADVWVSVIPFEETRTYVSKVMGNLARYAYLEGGEAAVPVVQLELPPASTEETAEY
jgi:soluble lytic murein transglycosylase